MRRLMVRAAIVVAIAVAVPACGGGSGGGGSATIVGSDDFSVFPGTAWTLNSGSPSQDAGLGNPPPCVACNTGPVDETTESVALYGTPGVTLSCHMALVGSGPGRARFKVSDDTVVGCEASAEIDGAAGTIDYSIGATTSTIATANDGTFHSFHFSVDGLGVARWFRDGVLIMTQAGFPAGSLRIKLRGSGGGASPTTTALFDNVLVTTP